MIWKFVDSITPGGVEPPEVENTPNIPVEPGRMRQHLGKVGLGVAVLFAPVAGFTIWEGHHLETTAHNRSTDSDIVDQKGFGNGLNIVGYVSGALAAAGGITAASEQLKSKRHKPPKSKA